MIGRHVLQEVLGRVLIDQAIHVAFETVGGVIQTAHGQHTVEQIRPTEEEVGCMETAHGATGRHEHLLIIATDIGQQFVRHIAEPAFVLFDAPTFVSTLVRPSLPVNAIHTDHPDPSGIDQRSQYIEHVIILPIIKTSILTRESQKSLSVVTEDLVFHLAAEIVAPPFVIFYVHIIY